MATSVSTEDLAKHLECGICLERFEDPKVLTCQHMYCRKCLEKLVTKVGREDFVITCPECRRKTQVPDGDVSGLPCNYVINNLLSQQSDPAPSCKKHDGEKLKILCQTCDKLICHYCVALDHRDHSCAYIKEVFPAEKKKILRTMEESKVNIRSLESSIETFKEQEESLNKNFLEVNQKIDSFIDKQIEFLQMKRRSVKDDLRNSVLIQKKDIHSQKEFFVLSIDRLKNIVSSTEKSLSKGNEMEILLAKNQMIQQLKEINSTTADLQPRGKVTYDLEVHPPLDKNTVGKIAKVKEYDQEYKLTIVPDIPTVNVAVFKFLHPAFESSTTEGEAFKSRSQHTSIFYLRPKRNIAKYKCAKYNQDNKAQVNFKAPDSNICSTDIESERDGSFSFGYLPEKPGNYKIEVIINGRYLHGSPFTWEVS